MLMKKLLNIFNNVIKYKYKKKYYKDKITIQKCTK